MLLRLPGIPCQASKIQSYWSAVAFRVTAGIIVKFPLTCVIFKYLQIWDYELFFANSVAINNLISHESEITYFIAISVAINKKYYVWNYWSVKRRWADPPFLLTAVDTDQRAGEVAPLEIWQDTSRSSVLTFCRYSLSNIVTIASMIRAKHSIVIVAAMSFCHPLCRQQRYRPSCALWQSTFGLATWLLGLQIDLLDKKLVRDHWSFHEPTKDVARHPKVRI